MPIKDAKDNTDAAHVQYRGRECSPKARGPAQRGGGEGKSRKGTRTHESNS